jgi:hypothetical protein
LETGDFDESVITASIDNALYSAIQNQAVREAKSGHNEGRFATKRVSRSPSTTRTAKST